MRARAVAGPRSSRRRRSRLSPPGAGSPKRTWGNHPTTAVVAEPARREDAGAARRLVDVSGIQRPQGGRKMSEEERIETTEESDDDVEAHRRRHLADEAGEQENDEGDDVEAHRRKG